MKSWKEIIRDSDAARANPEAAEEMIRKVEGGSVSGGCVDIPPCAPQRDASLNAFQDKAEG